MSSTEITHPTATPAASSVAVGTRATAFAAAAERYAELGWALARADGKQPKDRDWQNATVPEPRFAAGQWVHWGEQHNIGVVLGPSKLAVVEFDTDDAGATLIKLLDGNLPDTAIAQSGSGRLHFYFRDNGYTHATRDGLELRCGAHLMVLPPSTHPDTGRPYTWTVPPWRIAPGEVPAAVLDYFTETTTPQNGTAVHGGPITLGQRNNALTKLAGSARRQGAEQAEILALLRATNERCTPPLPDAEVVQIAASVCRYSPAQAAERIDWMLLSEVEMRSIIFVDRPLFQADAFHNLVGRKGQGKGTLLAMTAARVTRGELGDKQNVIWIASEDSAAIDLKPRIVAAGGDPARVQIVANGWVQLPRDIPEISRAIEGFGNVGMLVVDPVGNHIAGKNSNSETDIREAIAPLNALADEHKMMVFGVRHLSEKECRNGVLAAILGSSAWSQVPRVVLAVARDDEDPSVSHIQCVAGNRIPPGTPGRMFRISGVLLPELEEDVTRAEWLGESLKDIDAMLSREHRQESKSAQARELILDELEQAGPTESDTFDKLIADKTGLSARTIKNLRQELRDAGLIKSKADKDEHGTVLRWHVSRTNAPRERRS